VIKLRPLARATTQRQLRQGHKMKNEKDIINAVVKITAIAHSFSSDKREVALTRFILSNYYDVCCFFLKVPDDFNSGLNMNSVELFIEKMDEILNSIQN
jgi:hypothetical protein